jgi:hypothetical protein
MPGRQLEYFRIDRSGTRHRFTYGINSRDASPYYNEIKSLRSGCCAFISIFGGESIDEQVSSHPGGEVVGTNYKISAERRKSATGRQVALEKSGICKRKAFAASRRFQWRRMLWRAGAFSEQSKRCWPHTRPIYAFLEFQTNHTVRHTIINQVDLPRSKTPRRATGLAAYLSECDWSPHFARPMSAYLGNDCSTLFSTLIKAGIHHLEVLGPSQCDRCKSPTSLVCLHTAHHAALRNNSSISYCRP